MNENNRKNAKYENRKDHNNDQQSLKCVRKFFFKNLGYYAIRSCYFTRGINWFLLWSSWLHFSKFRINSLKIISILIFLCSSFEASKVWLKVWGQNQQKIHMDSNVRCVKKLHIITSSRNHKKRRKSYIATANHIVAEIYDQRKSIFEMGFCREMVKVVKLCWLLACEYNLERDVAIWCVCNLLGQWISSRQPQQQQCHTKNEDEEKCKKMNTSRN